VIVGVAGLGFTVILNEAVAVQFPASVTVTVYVPVVRLVAV
jgi:hypothetical protein